MNGRAHVEYRGPIFRGEAGKAAKKALNTLIIDVSKAAVSEVKAELSPGHGKDSGAFRRGIKRRKRGLSSTVSASNPMIAQWLEGTQKRNRTTRFKGYQVFATAFRRVDAGAGAEARKAGRQISHDMGG